MTFCSEANAKFCLDFFRRLRKDHPEESILFSPLNMSASLNLLRHGSRGDSATEIEKVLHLIDEKEHLSPESRENSEETESNNASEESLSTAFKDYLRDKYLMSTEAPEECIQDAESNQDGTAQALSKLLEDSEAKERPSVQDLQEQSSQDDHQNQMEPPESNRESMTFPDGISPSFDTHSEAVGEKWLKNPLPKTRHGINSRESKNTEAEDGISPQCLLPSYGIKEATNDLIHTLENSSSKSDEDASSDILPWSEDYPEIENEHINQGPSTPADNVFDNESSSPKNSQVSFLNSSDTPNPSCSFSRVEGAIRHSINFKESKNSEAEDRISPQGVLLSYGISEATNDLIQTLENSSSKTDSDEDASSDFLPQSEDYPEIEDENINQGPSTPADNMFDNESSSPKNNQVSFLNSSDTLNSSCSFSRVEGATRHNINSRESKNTEAEATNDLIQTLENSSSKTDSDEDASSDFLPQSEDYPEIEDENRNQGPSTPADNVFDNESSSPKNNQVSFLNSSDTPNPFCSFSRVEGAIRHSINFKESKNSEAEDRISPQGVLSSCGINEAMNDLIQTLENSSSKSDSDEDASSDFLPQSEDYPEIEDENINQGPSTPADNVFDNESSSPKNNQVSFLNSSDTPNPFCSFSRVEGATRHNINSRESKNTEAEATNDLIQTLENSSSKSDSDEDASSDFLPQSEDYPEKEDENINQGPSTPADNVFDNESSSPKNNQVSFLNSSDTPNPFCSFSRVEGATRHNINSRESKNTEAEATNDLIQTLENSSSKSDSDEDASSDFLPQSEDYPEKEDENINQGPSTPADNVFDNESSSPKNNQVSFLNSSDTPNPFCSFSRVEGATRHNINSRESKNTEAEATNDLIQTLENSSSKSDSDEDASSDFLPQSEDYPEKEDENINQGPSTPADNMFDNEISSPKSDQILFPNSSDTLNPSCSLSRVEGATRPNNGHIKKLKYPENQMNSEESEGEDGNTLPDTKTIHRQQLRTSGHKMNYAINSSVDLPWSKYLLGREQRETVRQIWCQVLENLTAPHENRMYNYISRI